MKTNIYIILGPPGSGKGTQAKKIAQKFGFLYFGTGDLMRKEAETGSEIGLEFQKIWDEGEGKLVPESLVEKFIIEKLNQLDFSRGVVFDGFPRTMAQAEMLEEVFAKRNIKEYAVINLEVKKDEIVDRTSTRRICQSCETIFEDPEEKGIKACEKCGGKLIQRDEDKPEVVKKRLDVYAKQTEPLIKFYNEKEKLINVDGNPSIDDVWANILKIINDQS